jgi:hypothetical protein
MKNRTGVTELLMAKLLLTILQLFTTNIAKTGVLGNLAKEGLGKT